MKSREPSRVQRIEWCCRDALSLYPNNKALEKSPRTRDRGLRREIYFLILTFIFPISYTRLHKHFALVNVYFKYV